MKYLRVSHETESRQRRTSSSTLTVFDCLDQGTSYLLRDGLVDATDVTCAISHLLGLNPDVFSLKAADQNADGVVDILDVTALIEKIRTKQ